MLLRKWNALIFKKTEFYAAITFIVHQAFKKTIILSYFCQTGLISFDPQVVIKRLRELNTLSDNSFCTPSPDSVPITSHMPLTISNVLQFILNTFVRGSLVQAYMGAQAQKELLHTHAAEQARAARQNGQRRVLQRGRALYASNAHKALKHREGDDLYEAQAVLI